MVLFFCYDIGMEDYKIMNINEFADEVRKKILKKMDAKDVRIKSVLKNNDVMRLGIVIDDERNIKPVIYLEEYFEMYKLGLQWKSIIEQIIYKYYEASMEVDIDFGFMQDWNALQNRIIYKLINKKANVDLLKTVPYVEFMEELAIVFCIMMPDEVPGMVLIENDICEAYEIDANKLWEIAKENTPRLLPVYFELIQQKSPIIPTDMYILSNEKRTCGAAVILYQGCLEKIADELQSNYYIVLASVHDLVIIPDTTEISLKDLSAITKKTNGTISFEDILGVSIYYYDNHKSILRIL